MRAETSSKFCGRNVTKVCEHANEPRGKIPVSFDVVNESRSFFRDYFPDFRKIVFIKIYNIESTSFSSIFTEK